MKMKMKMKCLNFFVETASFFRKFVYRNKALQFFLLSRKYVFFYFYKTKEKGNA